MAVRKFLDENGAAKLNELLANKFQSKIDKTDGLVIKELTSPVEIFELDDGMYKLPESCTCYYNSTHNGGTSISNSTGYLFVTSYSTTYKQFFIFVANNTTRYLKSGYATSTTGSYKDTSLTSILTSISSYVKNDLNYSTSSTTYALSAYQGYLLNQNKADKTEIPTKTSDLTNDSGFLTSHQDISGKEDTTNKVTSINSSSTDTEYPSAKLLFDQINTRQKNITYSTTDLTPGTSALNTGEIYVVYE